MAFDMDSDRCVGFKRRITEIAKTQEILPPPPPPPPPPSTSLPSIPQEDKQEQDTTENKNLGLLSESKKTKCSPYREASASIIEENPELGFASGAEQGQEILDSLVSGCEQLQKTKNCVVGSASDGEVKREKFDFVREETVKESFSSGFMKSEVGFVGIQQFGIAVVESEMGSAVEGDHELGFDAFKENKEELGEKLESESYLEVKKKQLLGELDVMYMAEHKTHVTDFEGSIKIDGKDGNTDGMGSGCQEVQNDAENVDVLIDKTALIEFNDQNAERKSNKDVKQEMDGKKARRPPRKAKKMLEMEMEMNGRHKNVILKGKAQNGCRKVGDGSKKVYSRKDMEVLRFANIVEQRNMWKDIYNGLGPAVGREYDDLASGKNQKHIRLNVDPWQQLMKKEEAPAILREACSENMDSDFKNMENNKTEGLSPLDGHSVGGEDSYTGLEEDCSEDDDSDEDYASIQKPAFMVKGEPNFDSGPPEDGLEFLRRVRWEAAQIPKVKVAKFDRSKLNKEQSVYMPEIPDIVKCPEHLLPLKQWEDEFLADFSELRLVLSDLEGASAEASGKLESMYILHEKSHSRQLPGGIVVENIDKLATRVGHSNQPHNCFGPENSDQPSFLTTENCDSSLASKILSPKTSAGESSSPLLFVISRMDSVARVSMLRKRITSVETMNTLSRNDCVWLFALCAVVDTPLDGDTCAALRSLLRKCASLRAMKSELDDEVVMLNILATIAGRYFGQSES